MMPPEAIEKMEIDPEDYVWINGFSLPPARKVQPVHAFLSVLRLITNKEDTRQVFEIVQAMAGASGHRLFKRFTDTDYGRRVVSEPVKLEELLGDRERLRAFPEGSLARAYLAFMEGENLTPEGLRSAAEEAGIDYDGYPEFSEYTRLFMHLQVNHDLWHVLSGYGRDALGELCNLVFTRQQTRNPGFQLIVLIGGIALKLDNWSVPTIKALREAGRNARRANWIMQYDVEALLALPVATVREKLNLATGDVYHAIPSDVRYALLKPKVRETQSEREQAARDKAAMQSV